MKTLQSKTGTWIARSIFLLTILIVGTHGAAAQWATDGNNINNTNSGNVGIGTSTPATRLQIIGNDSERGVLRLRNVGSTGYSGIEYERGSDGAVTAYVGIDSSNAFFRFNSINNHPLAFLTESIERIRITSSGNVGIGTITPGAKFEVDGSGLIRVTEGSRVVPTSGVGLELSANSSGSFVGAYNRSTSSYRRLYFYGSPYVFEAGNVGIGVEEPQYKLDVQGDIRASGTIFAKYQDLAEWVPSSEQLAAGTVVVLDTTKSNQVISSIKSYDTSVAGVISAQPGITLGESGEGKVMVATTGRVRVKVDATRAPIQIGDLLVTSDVTGVAMKSEAINLGGVQIHRPGTIVGKALESLAKGKGEILVLLSLQ